MSHRIFYVLSIAVLLVLIIAIGIWRGFPIHKVRSPSMSTPDGRPNFVLIVMDTVRRDRLSLYGYPKKTTPFLEELSQSSVVYDNAYSTSGWTSPAHASLFTGLFPIAHKTTQENWFLNQQLTTVAESLQRAGYETVGLSENPWVSKNLGFDKGFEEFREIWKSKDDLREADPCLRVVREFLVSRKDAHPFFLFLNLMEAHNPYNSSRHFYDTFISDGRLTCEDNRWREYFLGEAVFNDREVRHLNELYDAEIMYVDYVISQISKELATSGFWDDTVLIVTSDHGENIGDHGMMDHVFSLYESIVRIPLLIHYPKLFPPKTRNSAIVQLVDIYPTVAEVAGTKMVEGQSQGISLLHKDDHADRAVFCEYYYPIQALSVFKEKEVLSPRLEPFKRRMKAVIFQGRKMIWGTDGRTELFNLAEYPDEQQQVSDEPDSSEWLKILMAKLREMVDRYRRDDIKPGGRTGPGIDSATREKLRSLGYLR